MDAYIKFLDNKGGRHLIAVETKYTDELGVNEASHCEEQKQMLIDTRLFDSEFEELLLDGKVKLTQVYRNFLLTERYRIVEGLKDSFSVVLSPKDHPSTGEEIKSVARYLKPEYAYKLRAVTLEDCKHLIKYTLYSPPLFRYFANKKAMKRIMSKEEFLSVYERQQVSGLTIKDFCENEAYSSSCFHYWKKKFGLSRTYTSHPDKLPDDTFIPLDLCRRGNLPSGAGGNVTIELPSGIRIHFDSPGNPELTFGLIHKLCGHVLSE